MPAVGGLYRPSVGFGVRPLADVPLTAQDVGLDGPAVQSSDENHSSPAEDAAAGRQRAHTGSVSLWFSSFEMDSFERDAECSLRRAESPLSS